MGTSSVYTCTFVFVCARRDPVYPWCPYSCVTIEKKYIHVLFLGHLESAALACQAVKDGGELPLLKRRGGRVLKKLPVRKYLF